MAGKLKLNLYNVEFERISDSIEVRMEHTVLNTVIEAGGNIKNGRLTITEIDTSQGGRYVVWVRPDHYRSIVRIVVVEEGNPKDEHIVFPIRPDRVSKVDFPGFMQLAADLRAVLNVSDVESQTGMQGQQLYDALNSDFIRCAGMFNLYAKMKATVLGNGRDVFSYVQGFTRLRGDRIFAKVDKTLRDDVKNDALAGKFSKVDNSLHTPPPDYVSVDSYKSSERYGNLQLTFFCEPQTLEFLIDADIDDAQGIEHIFQVAEHMVTGDETNPYDIHEILVFYQHINPGYQILA